MFLLSLRPFLAPCLPVTNVQWRLTSPSTKNSLLSLTMLIDLSPLPSTCYYQRRPRRIIDTLKGFQLFGLWYCLHYQGTAGESRRHVVNRKRWAETRGQGRRNKNWGTEKKKTPSIFEALIMNEEAFVRWLDFPFYLYCFNELMTLPILFILHALAMTHKFNWWRKRQSSPVSFVVYKKWCAVYQASIYLY